MWSQLRLVPRLYLPTISGAKLSGWEGDIVLSFGYAAPAQVAARPVQGCKGRAVEFQSLHPPDGVPTIKLESIDITLHFRTSLTGPASSPLYRPEKEERSCRLQLHTLDWGFSNQAEELATQPASTEQTMYLDSVRGSQQHAASTKRNVAKQFAFAVLDRSVAQRKAAETATVVEVTDHDEPSFSGDMEDRPVKVRSHSHLQHMLELIDAAMGTLICGHSRETAAGFRSSNGFPQTVLSDMLPALFSPGYLPVRVPT